MAEVWLLGLRHRWSIAESRKIYFIRQEIKMRVPQVPFCIKQHYSGTLSCPRDITNQLILVRSDEDFIIIFLIILLKSNLRGDYLLFV